MRYVTVTAAAHALRTSRMTIARLVEAGELEARKPGDRHNSPVDIDADSIVDYIRRHTIPASAA